MSESSDILLIKLEGRNWRYRIRQIEDEHSGDVQVPETLGGIDVLVIRGTERTRNVLQDWIQGNHPSYSATMSSGDDPFLVIGPERLVARFLRGLNNKAALPPAQDSDISEVGLGRYPDLPSLSDIPRLAREDVIDPFGSNETLLAASWSEAAAAAGSLATRLHAVDTAVTLPEPDPGRVDAWTQAWSAAVQISPGPADVSKILRERGSNADWTELTTLTAKGLNMIQRCLVAACVSGPIDDDVLDDLARTVEHVGYCLIASSTPGDLDESVEFEFYLGALIARLHSIQTIHGDIHRANFSYNREEHKMVVLDSGSLCLLRRDLTVPERARDVAVFKLQCSGEQWEAFKLGYSLSEHRSEFADGVFALV